MTPVTPSTPAAGASAGGPAPPGTSRARGRTWLIATAWGLAGVVVVAGVVAQVWRPLAPDLGPPPAPSAFFDAAHLARVEAYQVPRRAVGLAALLVRLAVPVLALASPWGRRAVAAVASWAGGDRRPALAAGAVGVAVVAASDLAVLPLGFWSGYVHEGAFGLRTQGLGGWLTDRALATAPTWLLVGAGLAAASVAVRRLPRAWPPVLGLAAGLLAAVLVSLSPLVLEPLRFSFEPLPAGEVRTVVTGVLDRADVEVDALLVADASRRTTRQNAYVSGLGATRRVVLYDTLLAGRSAEEIGFVFAHELGHDRHADLARGTLLAAAGCVIAALAVAAALRRGVTTGRLRSATDPRAAALVVAVVVVLSALSLPVQSAVSRRAEAAADVAALELSADPAAAAGLYYGLATSNLTDPDPPTWARLLWSSHPSPTERLHLVERWPIDFSASP